jgi:hypothetical protein
MMELSIYLLQGTYPKKMKSVCQEDTYTPMFINKTWKQPRYLSMDEWFCNVVYAYTVEYYSTLKRNGMPVTERQIPCNFFFMGLGLTSGFCVYKAGIYSLSHTSSPFCSGYLAGRGGGQIL